MSKETILNYYEAFNKKDWAKFFSLLDPNVSHEINQAHTELGIEKFKKFIFRMNAYYDEEIKDILIFTADQNHFAVTYMVHGKYHKTDDGLPEAHGQKYAVKGGAFFVIKNGKISSVTNYYNLSEWITQVR